MRNQIIFFLVALGIAGALYSAYLYAVPGKPLPPVFNPAPNPYAQGIYANGIIESYQENGENTNMVPEVSGTLVKVFVTEGQAVAAGAPLIALDDSIQAAVVAQQEAQAAAARSLLEALRAQPRKENLEVARAQVDLAAASLKSAEDQLDKQARSQQLAPESVSRDAYDNAVNAAKVAKANMGVVSRQYELTKAGAWKYDVATQERQVEALAKSAAASRALLSKYTLRAPTDGVVLSIRAAAGSYASPQGVYDSYTQSFRPLVVIGTATAYLSVRCYIDEILIPRLPPPERMESKMFIRGTSVSLPLEFVRVQPYVSPKIALSNERTEKVDLRVLPVLFRFLRPKDVKVYPGELVDVYVGSATPAVGVR